MNKIAEEISSYYGSHEMSEDEFLQHYGVGHLHGGHSGRYPWGSGKDDYQHSVDFLGRIAQLRKKGWKETPENIRKEFDLSVKEYRMEKTLCSNERRMQQVARVETLKRKDFSNNKIARELGINESTVRSLLNEDSKRRMEEAKNTAEYLKKRVEKDRMIDVGVNAEIGPPLNISREKLDTALYMLQSQGYGVYSNRIPQPTNKNNQTTQKVLCAKDIKPPEGKSVPKEIYEYDKIKSLNPYISRDNGITFEKKFNYPASMDSKRMMVRYAEDKGPDGITGDQKDGLIEIRRGVPDLNLGESRYAQVRILIDGTHYAKGMAVYSDDMPDGIDVIFNTNKKSGTPMKSSDKNAKQVLKPIKNDPENPFGSAIKDADQGGQYFYDSKTGEIIPGSSKNPNKKLGLINKRSDERDWNSWKDTLPSQFLSKQSKYLAKKQLDLAKADKIAEFDEYKHLTNPTIKKYYLEKFAQSCDKAAVDLKAAALPGQKYHVIIPVNTLGDNEIYAPQYKAGTKLALIRYPHGGRFEIPILTVTDKNALAKKIIGPDSIDAVGITKKVAEQLSGADFDGDTVMCIPTHDRKGKVKILNNDGKPLDGLKGFDNKMYQYDEPPKTDKDGTVHYYRNGKEFKVMKNTDNQMGVISNLISDMTLQGATKDELARAVRHSMVVIDAEKHKLDYRASEIENDIASLKQRYQMSVDKDGNVKYGGASTIVSRAKGEINVPKRKGQPRINQKGKDWYDPSKPEGALIYNTTDLKDLYYADSTLDKKTGVRTLVTTSGKSIKYNVKDAGDREKYTPVMHINEKTGAVSFTNKDGSISYRKKMRTTTSTRMAEVEDAKDLMSNPNHPYPMEVLYADYANSMKALANSARKEMIYTKSIPNNPNAKKVYAKEVSELNAALNIAKKNSPMERQVLRSSNVEIAERKRLDPYMKPSDERKLAQRTVTKYRNELGTIARRDRAIVITDKQWSAIQAGAISENKLKEILKYTDADSLRERAMPKQRKSLNQAQINRIKRLADSNFTLQQIADKMNVSTSMISYYLKGE